MDDLAKGDVVEIIGGKWSGNICRITHTFKNDSLVTRYSVSNQGMHEASIDRQDLKLLSEDEYFMCDWCGPQAHEDNQTLGDNSFCSDYCRMWGTGFEEAE
jgi:ribosomal 30S subunit maturation factor RimM